MELVGHTCQRGASRFRFALFVVFWLVLGAALTLLAWWGLVWQQRELEQEVVRPRRRRQAERASGLVCQT